MNRFLSVARAVPIVAVGLYSVASMASSFDSDAVLTRETGWVASGHDAFLIEVLNGLEGAVAITNRTGEVVTLTSPETGRSVSVPGTSTLEWRCVAETSANPHLVFVGDRTTGNPAYVNVECGLSVRILSVPF